MLLAIGPLEATKEVYNICPIVVSRSGSQCILCVFVINSAYKRLQSNRTISSLGDAVYNLGKMGGSDIVILYDKTHADWKSIHESWACH